MKKNLYFKFVYQSTRTLEAHVVAGALRILSFPRTLLEVFIRKNMGERYFGAGQAILIVLGLGFLAFVYTPVLYMTDARNSFHERLEANGYRYDSSFDSGGSFTDSFGFYVTLHFLTWYLFLLVFLYVSYVRYQEIKRLPSVFDFARSSVYTGDIHPFFINFKWKNKNFDVRQIETVLEPLFFFIIGLGLIILQQYIGYVIIISSIGYSLSARIGYIQGDHFIMDIIDNQLFNQEKDEAFVKGNEINNDRGVRYYGRRPTNPEDRKKLSDDFDDEEIAEVK